MDILTEMEGFASAGFVSFEFFCSYRCTLCLYHTWRFNLAVASRRSHLFQEKKLEKLQAQLISCKIELLK